jgi:hypothetical protein
MATITVNVHNDHFVQSSTTGSDGDTVQFINDRGSGVTVTLTNGFSKGHLDLGTGSDSKTKSAQINISSGKATFKAPQGGTSPKQGDQDLKGDITVNPSK